MNRQIETEKKDFPAWLTLSWAWEQSMEDPSEVRAALARNLRRLREDRGLTQKSLAERAGASLASLKDIESGRVLPDIALIADLARALGIPCPGLLVGPS
jgi:DNA-binding XRE family transcriptional regulator